MLRPSHGPVDPRHIRGSLRDFDPPASRSERQPTLEFHSRQGEVGLRGEPAIAGLDIPIDGRRLSMHPEASLRLLVGRYSENVEAQIVTGDSRKQSGLHALSVLRVGPRVVSRRIDGLPWRIPKGIDTVLLKFDSCNMAAARKQGKPEAVVLQMNLASVAEAHRPSRSAQA